MERRLSERIEFFKPHAIHYGTDCIKRRDLMGDIVSGFILDVGDNGMRIDVDASTPLLEKMYRLMLRTDDDSAGVYSYIGSLRQLWSCSDGVRGISYGFAFDGQFNLTMLLDRVIDARMAGHPALRCGLIGLRQVSTRRLCRSFR